MELIQKCTKCKEYKNYSEYHKDCSRTRGVSSKCKQCDRQRAKEYATKRRLLPGYKESQKRWQRTHYKNNPQKQLWQGAKKRARDFNIPINIKKEDINIPLLCPLLQVPMIVGTPYAPSIDKIIPEKGYVKGNIMVISRKANTMKNNASIEQLKVFAENILRLYK